MEGVKPGTSSRVTRYLPFVALLLANFMEILNAMFVNISMPIVARDLAASANITHWFYSSYALGFAVTLVLTGRIADQIGHRRVFLTGTGIYILASITCGLSGNITTFLLARILQGAAFAMTAPQVMGLLHILYSPQDRVRLLPALGFASASAGTLGPVLAGILISGNLADLSWRIVFFVGAMIGVIAFSLGFTLLPRNTHSGDGKAFPINRLPLLATVTGLIAAFEWLGRNNGAIGPWATGLLTFPLGGILLIKRRSFSRRRPLGVPADVTPMRQLATGAMLTVCFSATSNSLMIIINHILQSSRGLSPYIAGSTLIPYGLGVFFSILLFGRFILKSNGRLMLAAGAALLGIAAPTVMLAGRDLHWPVWALLPILSIAGMGVGMTSGCIGPASMARVPPARAAASAATLRLGQQMGLALGGAVIMRPYFHLISQNEALDAAPAFLPPYLIALLMVLITAMALAVSFPKPLFPDRR